MCGICGITPDILFGESYRQNYRHYIEFVFQHCVILLHILVIKCPIVGDGTEDISCKMDSSNWKIEENITGIFSAEDAANYWHKLRTHFVSYLVYPGLFPLQAPYPVKIGQVPPVLNPMIAGRAVQY